MSENNKKQKFKKNHFIIVVSIFLISLFLALPTAMRSNNNDVTTISYNDFLKMVDEKAVKEISINFTEPTFTFKDNNDEIKKTDNPRTENFKEFLLTKDIKIIELNSKVSNIISNTIQNLIFVVIFVLMSRKVMGSISNKNSNIENCVDELHLSLNDVVGCEEQKEEIQSLVTFLKTPEKYVAAGAKFPKGVILYGPPGTGKTLIAKAIAGEANVSFFSISGSDLMEKFVGVGAERVRKLFANAKKKGKCIIFIDEIDAIGSKRGLDNNGERDLTINALLTELDGFKGRDGILVIAATNRFEILDDALIRPGRFDKHISIPLPDKKDRFKLFKKYTSNKKLADDVDLKQLVKMTYKFSGADIESLINEATILSVNNNCDVVNMSNLNDAYYKILMKGHKKKNGHNDEKTKELIAYHEAGHALVAKLLTNSEVSNVSIIPSTSGAGGVTFIIPPQDVLLSKADIHNNIQIKFGGRAAELILKGNEDFITTGASNDIETATLLIKETINTYGMDETIGMLNLKVLDVNSDDVFERAKVLAKRLYEDTVILLQENKNTLISIADALIEFEIIDEKLLDSIINSSQKIS